MRIAFVVMETTHSRDTEGTRRFERIADQLEDRGHEVTVFCSQWWDDYTDEFRHEGIEYKGVTLGPVTSSFCVRLPALLARFGPDVVHATPLPPEQVLAAGAGSTLARAPLVVEWYGDEYLTGDERATGRAVTRPDRIISPSELVRTDVRELGATGEQTDVIPEGIDYSLVESVDPDGGVDLVYARRLDDSANLGDLLLALAELRDRDWGATIIGDGPEREQYERQARDLRIDDRIEFLGTCDRSSRLAAYRGAHVFVHTAYREFFPTELLWALACGCVGIVEYQAQSSGHELIEGYERSYRVTDPETLADAIADAGTYKHWTADDHWERYDHEAVIERYLDTYEAVQS